jgi:hypothetical protein
MQRSAHTGYELPPHHVADMQLLAEVMPTRRTGLCDELDAG